MAPPPSAGLAGGRRQAAGGSEEWPRHLAVVCAERAGGQRQAAGRYSQLAPPPLRTKRQDAASTPCPRRLRRSWQAAGVRRQRRVATASCRGVRKKGRRRRGRMQAAPPKSRPPPLRTKRQDAASTPCPRRLRRSWQVAGGRRKRVATASCRGVRKKGRRRRGRMQAATPNSRPLYAQSARMPLPRHGPAAFGGVGRRQASGGSEEWPRHLAVVCVRRADGAAAGCRPLLPTRAPFTHKAAGCRFYAMSPPPSAELAGGRRRAAAKSGHGILPWCA
jgi:hypothetical protein